MREHPHLVPNAMGDPIWIVVRRYACHGVRALVRPSDWARTDIAYNLYLRGSQKRVTLLACDPFSGSGLLATSAPDCPSRYQTGRQDP
jgi:hypothetical protein